MCHNVARRSNRPNQANEIASGHTTCDGSQLLPTLRAAKTRFTVATIDSAIAIDSRLSITRSVWKKEFAFARKASPPGREAWCSRDDASLVTRSAAGSRAGNRITCALYNRQRPNNYIHITLRAHVLRNGGQHSVYTVPYLRVNKSRTFRVKM